ncbi:DUF4113 domain-containing protein [Xanthomonas phaseoli]|uniref:DUF4113 domain-containing protein n=1 Tax=Xanthomonas phaseoli TaxID=1985254 RepID=UPI003AFFCD16
MPTAWRYGRDGTEVNLERLFPTSKKVGRGSISFASSSTAPDCTAAWAMPQEHLSKSFTTLG